MPRNARSTNLPEFVVQAQDDGSVVGAMQLFAIDCSSNLTNRRPAREAVATGRGD